MVCEASPLGRPNLIVFDLDGTLVDYRASSSAAYRAIFLKAEERFGPLPVDRLVGLLKAADAENWTGYVTGRIPLEEMWRRRWGGPLKTIGLSVDTGFLNELNEHFARVLPAASRLYPDAIPCLEGLKGRFRLALLSNSPGRTGRSRVDHLGLCSFFSYVGIGGEIGAMKPALEAFQIVLERAGGRPESTVMVGDNFNEDVLGGRSAGLKTVWLRRGDAYYRDGDPSKADGVVGDLKELDQLFSGA